MLSKRPLGPWRACEAAALGDAIAAGEASRDEHDGTVFMSVFCWVQELELAAQRAA